MGRQQSDPKAMAGNMASFAKELKSATPLIMQSARALDIWTASAQKAANAMARLRNGGGSSSAPAQRQYSAGGGGTGGGFGLTGIIGAGLVVNELRSAIPSLWGASLHGGPLRRGSFPGIEHVMDAFSGRDQREMVEDMRQAEIDRQLRQRGSYSSANLGYMSSTQQLQRSLLSAGAAPQEHLDLLGRQRSELRGSLGGLQREQTQIELDYRRATDRANIEHANRLQAHNNRMEGGQALPFGLPNAKDIPWFLSPLKIGAMAGSVLGDRMAVGNLDMESNSKAVQQQLEYAKKMQENLQAQKDVLEKIYANEQQQLEIAKGMAQSRQQGQLAYGALTPTEQRAAIDAARSLQAGQTISADEQSLLGRAGPYGQKLLQNAAFQNSGGYLDFLQAAGAPQKEIEQMRQGQQATALFQTGAGALGISLPAVEVNLTLNEQLLAQAIAKEAGETLRDVQAKVKQIADQVDKLEGLQQKQTIQRNTSTVGNILGR